MPGPVPAPGDVPALQQLSDFRGLLGLSMLMISTADVDDILSGATTAVPSFGGGRPVGVYFDGGWRRVGSAPVPPNAGRLAGQLAAMGTAGGPLELSGAAWSWAYPLAGLSGLAGYVIVSADSEPGIHHRFLLGVLFRQAGAAVENALLGTRLRASADELGTANAALEQSVAEAQRSMIALQRSLDIHDRLTRAAGLADGQAGIALALHELTGHPVAIEDRHGNLMAWAGPGRPDPYPKDPPAARERLLRRAEREGGILGRRDRLVAVARPDEHTVGVIALIRPSAAASDTDRVALEHAATVLALDLVRQRGVAETELRLRRDLVEDLLSGADPDSVQVRAWALGYDLTQTHRAIIVTGTSRRADQDALFHAVRRAARAGGIGTLVVARAGSVALLSHSDSDLRPFRGAILAELGTGATCRVGVGGPSADPAGFARSHAQAQLALKLQVATRSPDQVTMFEDLGVYRLLAEIENIGSVQDFVREWLGRLLEYDIAKGTQLVETLSEYLECGGNYDAAAKQLSLHRSTLRYRLQRIRVVSGLNLTDPDIRFNLQLATRAWTTVHAMSQS
jgi:sugar diacid utilization regulator